MNNNGVMNILMQFMGMGNNPETIINQILRSNPEMQVAINQMKQSGMSPKSYAMQLAKQQGTDISQMVNMMNQRGFKL